MDEEGRVGILMCAGCAFVCVFLFVSIALTEVAMQDRRLVSCADALSSVAVGSSSSDDHVQGGGRGGPDRGERARRRGGGRGTCSSNHLAAAAVLACKRSP